MRFLIKAARSSILECCYFRTNVGNILLKGLKWKDETRILENRSSWVGLIGQIALVIVMHFQFEGNYGFGFILILKHKFRTNSLNVC